MDKNTYSSVDHYIETFPNDDQQILRKIRQTITQAVPQAEETISYQMPAYKYHGWLAYFAAFKNHYSLFIPPSGVYEAFEKELKPYKHEKATLQFKKSEPVPFDLIAKLIKYAADRNSALKQKV